MMPCRGRSLKRNRGRGVWNSRRNSLPVALQKIGATGEKPQTVGDKISSVGQKSLPVTGVVTGLNGGGENCR